MTLALPHSPGREGIETRDRVAMVRRGPRDRFGVFSPWRGPLNRVAPGCCLPEGRVGCVPLTRPNKDGLRPAIFGQSLFHFRGERHDGLFHGSIMPSARVAVLGNRSAVLP